MTGSQWLWEERISARWWMCIVVFLIETYLSKVMNIVENWKAVENIPEALSHRYAMEEPSKKKSVRCNGNIFGIMWVWWSTECRVTLYSKCGKILQCAERRERDESDHVALNGTKGGKLLCDTWSWQCKLRLPNQIIMNLCCWDISYIADCGSKSYQLSSYM